MKEEIKKELDSLRAALPEDNRRTNSNIPKGYFDEMQSNVFEQLKASDRLENAKDSGLIKRLIRRPWLKIAMVACFAMLIWVAIKPKDTAVGPTVANTNIEEFDLYIESTIEEFDDDLLAEFADEEISETSLDEYYDEAILEMELEELENLL